MKNEATVRGEVIEALPNTMYRILLTDGREIIAYLGGKMKYNRIRVMLGDKVDVVLDPQGGKATNRIVYRA